MRRDLVLAALLLPLSGCYVPPPAGYAQPSYPPGYQPAPPGYPQPGLPPAGYDPYAYPGYSDNGGDPTLVVEGAVVPLVLFGGGWGYWDSRHNWHRAPDAVSRHLEQRRVAGGFHPGGSGFGQPRPEGRPPGPPNGGQTFFHPAEQGRPPPGAPNGGPTFSHAPQQARPAAVAVPAVAPRPAAPAREEHEHERGRDCPPGQRC